MIENILNVSQLFELYTQYMSINETTNKLQHVAIIMDGNGRWAKERGLPRLEGHKAGAESVRSMVHACIERDIPYLTLYAFSSENWKRPRNEVDGLMNLLEHFLKSKLKEFQRQGIRLQAIGRLDRLPRKTRATLERVIEETQNNTQLTLVLSLSYGGREEIVDATRDIAMKVAAGKISIQDVDNELFAEHLYTADIPDPDLLIRTSGEMRLSNFLLWQLSYAEIYVTKVFWPDFRHEEFAKAIDSYKRRQRRFGKV